VEIGPSKGITVKKPKKTAIFSQFSLYSGFFIAYYLVARCGLLARAEVVAAGNMDIRENHYSKGALWQVR
jgi:hypothetical protein